MGVRSRRAAREGEGSHSRARRARRRAPPDADGRGGEAYRFEGPDGAAGLLDLFAGRRQLLVYRFFFEPGVARWPEAGCGGCSMFTDQVGELAHLHARDTSFVLVSPAPQADIRRFRERIGWEIPWFTTRDDFSADFDVPEYFGLNSSCAMATGSSAPTSRPAGESRRSAASGRSST